MNMNTALKLIFAPIALMLWMLAVALGTTGKQANNTLKGWY